MRSLGLSLRVPEIEVSGELKDYASFIALLSLGK